MGNQNWATRHVSTPRVAARVGTPNPMSVVVSVASTTPRPPGVIRRFLTAHPFAVDVALAVIYLLILNALTLVTEFIGITMAAGYLGVPKLVAVLLAAGVILAAAATGSFRRFERIAVALCGGSLLLIPLFLVSHPSGAQMAGGFVTPGLPGGSGQMATVMLLIIGIVGTTVAPWQLFFQQSYVVDKRITPRFIRYEKVDLWIGIVIVVVGAAALMGATAAAFAGTAASGHFTDATGLAHGIAAHAGRLAGVVFAVAWSTRLKPRLAELLGSSAAAYSAAAARATAQRGIQRRIVLQEEDLVVDATSHLNSFVGIAYLRSQLPNGVSVDALR